MRFDLIKEIDIIFILQDHLEHQFPKVCGVCQHRYATLREYLELTKQLGSVMSHHAELENWQPHTSTGTIMYANCPCGNTLSLGSAKLPLALYHLVLAWARQEMQRQGVPSRQLFTHLRDEISKQVMPPPAQPVG